MRTIKNNCTKNYLNMSFLEQLCKKKNSLKNTPTVVTQPDGRRYLESKDTKTEIDPSYGFVVDTKPDKIPAKITENIYLGSQDCCDLGILEAFDIKHILSIGIEPPCTFPNFRYKFVRCLDLPETNIITVLQTDCIPFIKNVIENGEAVLVHCNAGVSRSSAVVVGFLMLVDNLPYVDAYNVVKSKRNCIKPNEGFEKQLRALNLKI